MRGLLIAALLAACSAGPPGPGIDADRALALATELAALGPRPGDSAGAQRAAALIEQRLGSFGVTVERMPVGRVHVPEIVVLGGRFRHGHEVETTDPNLIVRFGPPGKALLVMAHYDTVRGSPGAVDNAAAVGVLIELARVLSAAPPPIPVMLVFTANEEIGLVGAEALAERRGDQIAFAISLDLIGGTGELVLNGASTLIGRAELGWIADAADRAGVAVRVPLAHRAISRWWPQAERSDHGPFTRRGIPGLHFYDRGHDGEWIYLAYHSERDVAANIDRAAVDRIGRLLRALTAAAPPAHDGDAFWVPVATNTVIPRWTLVLAELVLAAFALIVLVRSRAERARGGLGLIAGIACVALALAATFAIERLTAGEHRARWLHAPLYFAIAEGLVLAGVLGLLTRLAARFRPWVGDRRYLAVGVAVPLVTGLAWLVAGAAELAWVWLVPAAVAAIGPRLGPARALAVLATALPAVLVLAPDRLREAAWNGFLPGTVPLVALIGLLGVPVIAMIAWAFRHKGHSGPLGTFILPMGWGLATFAGIVMLVRAPEPCSSAEFHAFSLGCESRTGVP